jgi:hypothetical protein
MKFRTKDRILSLVLDVIFYDLIDLSGDDLIYGLIARNIRNIRLDLCRLRVFFDHSVEDCIELDAQFFKRLTDSGRCFLHSRLESFGILLYFFLDSHSILPFYPYNGKNFICNCFSVFIKQSQQTAYRDHWCQRKALFLHSRCHICNAVYRKNAHIHIRNIDHFNSRTHIYRIGTAVNLHSDLVRAGV